MAHVSLQRTQAYTIKRRCTETSRAYTQIHTEGGDWSGLLLSAFWVLVVAYGVRRLLEQDLFAAQVLSFYLTHVSLLVYAPACARRKKARFRTLSKSDNEQRKLS